jgi:purine-nucleoside phosphorylase
MSSAPTPNTLTSRLEESLRHVRSKTSFVPEIGIILGSGLGGLADHVKPEAALPYGEIPNFHPVSVVGHKGQLLLGHLEGKRVLVMQGRFHYYEGWSMDQVTFPVRVMKQLGVKQLIVSNASGGVNRTFRVGDLMIITDVINLMFANPLRGPNDEARGARFPDMSCPFSPRLVDLALEVAREKKIRHTQGVYIGVTGPSYETRAELRFMSRIGGDAVGMSTVPEVIVARHEGIREILGISCVTDMATGEGIAEVTHEEVVKAAAEAGPRFVTLVREVVARM